MKLLLSLSSRGSHYTWNNFESSSSSSSSSRGRSGRAAKVEKREKMMGSRDGTSRCCCCRRFSSAPRHNCALSRDLSTCLLLSFFFLASFSASTSNSRAELSEHPNAERYNRLGSSSLFTIRIPATLAQLYLSLCS